MKDKDTLVLESLYNKVVEEAKTKSKTPVGYLLSNKVSPLTSKQKKKLKKELHSGEVKVKEEGLEHELNDFHPEIDGVNYYVGYTDSHGDIDIHEIVPHEGQGQNGDAPVYDVKNPEINDYAKLSDHSKRIFDIAKEKLEERLEEINPSEPDSNPNWNNPFSNQYEG